LRRPKLSTRKFSACCKKKKEEEEKKKMSIYVRKVCRLKYSGV
jgi:hypothetical protein